MHSPATAIAWEIWRKNRIALSLVAAAMPVSFLLRAILWPEAVQLFEGTAILASTVILFWVFSFTEMDARGRQAGFPSRMFVLPVRTVKLVSYPMLYGTGSILVFYFVWVGVIRTQWKLEISRGLMLPQATLLVAMMVSMQTTVWALHRFNWTRVFLLTAGGAGLGLLSIFLMAGEIWLNPRTLIMLAGGLALVSYVSAVTAVERERRGEWLGWLDQFFQRIFDALPWRRKPFASLGQAQFWIEWNRRGWLMVCALGSAMAFSLVLFPMATALYLDSTLALINFFALPIMTLWCVASTGMSLAKSDIWSPELTLQAITATRPISTGEVVLAKLKVAGVVTILGWILFGVLAWPAMQSARALGHLNEEVLQFWANFPAEHRALVRWVSNPVVLLTALGVTWHAFAQGMCPVLTGRVSKNFWAVGRGLTLFGMAVFVTGWVYQHQRYFPAVLMVLPWIIGAKLAWKWGTAARAFALAYRAALYSRQQWRALLASWFALTTGVVVSAYLACAANQLPAPIILLLAVWALPGGELANCPANLAKNRHR